LRCQQFVKITEKKRWVGRGSVAKETREGKGGKIFLSGEIGTPFSASFLMETRGGEVRGKNASGCIKGGYWKPNRIGVVQHGWEGEG